MKMVYAAVFTPTSTNVSQARSLRRAGVDLVEYDYRAAARRLGNIPARDKELVELVRSEKADALLLSKCNQMGRGVIEALRDEVRCLYWFMDPDWNFSPELLDMATACHHAFVSRMGALHKLRAYATRTGASTTAMSFLCEGFDADTDMPQEVEKVRDCCFIGEPRKDRKHYIEHLNIPCIQGRFGKDHAVTVGETKVNINFTEGDGCSDRVYKVLAAGGFLLTQPWKGMESHFTPGVHLDIFRTPEELKEKMDYYTSDEVMRDQIAAAGLSRVQMFSRDEWAQGIVRGLK